MPPSRSGGSSRKTKAPRLRDVADVDVNIADESNYASTNSPAHEESPGSPERARFDNSRPDDYTSTSARILQDSNAISGIEPISLDNPAPPPPLGPEKLASNSISLADGELLATAIVCGPNTPNIDGLSERKTSLHRPDQGQQGQLIHIPNPPVSQSQPPHRRYFAYVEDADNDSVAAPVHPATRPSTGQRGRTRIRIRPRFPISERDSHSSEKASRSSSFSTRSVLSNKNFSSRDFNKWRPGYYDDSDEITDQPSTRGEEQLRPSRLRYRSEPRNLYYAREPPAPTPPTIYPPPPFTARRVPSPIRYESPFVSYDPYDQYQNRYGPSGYSNYGQRELKEPHQFRFSSHNPWATPYFPPPGPYNLFNSGRIVSGRNAENRIPYSGPIFVGTTQYKAATSSDNSGRDISFQIPLKSTITDNGGKKGKSVGFDFAANDAWSGYWETNMRPIARDGESRLTIIRSLEHFADRLSQDRITMMCPQTQPQDQHDGVQVLRWLHLQQNTFCLNDLHKLVLNCQYLDEDYITLADCLLEIECAKREKKYSNGSNQGYYMEPGTVLRCDVKHDQEPARCKKSVFFCSVPYLQLGKREKHRRLNDKDDNRLHPARTLMESLYEYDLIDDRDSRQAIRQCPPSEQDNILYLPQICPQSAMDRIEALRSNAGGYTIDDYDLVLENDEHLIPKNWLDIIARDPLPLLEITLKLRTKTKGKSLALTLKKRSRSTLLGEYNSVDSQNSETDTSNDSALNSPGSKRPMSSRKSSDHTWPSTSYKPVNIEDNVEHIDEPPILSHSLESRLFNSRRRMAALSSAGMIVNDFSLVENEPEVFSATEHVARDYITSTKLRSSHDRSTKHSRAGGRRTLQTPQTNSITVDNRRPEVTQQFDQYGLHGTGQAAQTSGASEQHQDRLYPIIPFLQWDADKSGEDQLSSGVLVRQVLDQVNDRLLRNADYRKIYKTSHISTLEELQGRESPLYAETDSRLTDEILSFRERTASKRKIDLFQSSKNLIEMFIPINFDHDTTRKIWGAVSTICQVLGGIVKSTPEGCGDYYCVQDYTNENDLILQLTLPKPEPPLKDCNICTRGFKSLEDGIAHLGAKHFPSIAGNQKLELWLRTPQQVHVEARINVIVPLLEDCTNAFKKLNVIAQDLHFGSIKAGDISEANGYPIFESLVRVFEHITTILVFSSSFIVKADKATRKPQTRAPNSKRFRSRLADSLRKIVSNAREDLGQAKIDIILASKTERHPGDVVLPSIGPEFLIATISSGLFLRQAREAPGNSTYSNDNTGADHIESTSIDVNELYKRYANKLQLQVNQRPQKRLLPAIYALEEELDILIRLNNWQRVFCEDFLRTLDPASYRITTKARISYFGTESRYLLKTIQRLDAQHNELRGLQQRSEKLRDQLQQSIEIEEESHGNAIRVFTFVTLFFLPLSFVTSFFGMNTVDIRDIENDQRVFWIASVPTTALVIGVAYLYGYKWEIWKEDAIRRRSNRLAKQTNNDDIRGHVGRAVRLTHLWKLPFWRSDTYRDVEKGGNLRRGTDLSFMSTDSATHVQRKNT
ncbi:hypothetical protein NPX13_g6437 [Xylaria arbuscula]|uniref:Uncharacterized protein n=1 Tax=Xylaria arbuscula TaxID=114810 RepID=A0A9W8TLF2_9PEZI|nr:hypothetical protein NPX13_g6437 [Xylaria arbuscula]